MRRTVWLRARQVRGQLLQYMPQAQVGACLGISQQAVERIELVAPSKILAAFASDRINDATA